MAYKPVFVACVVAIAVSVPMHVALAEDPMPAKGLLAQQGPDLWRGSKLIGVDIYGPDIKKVGDISDVLMDHGGKATYAIIGVGGFLGIGQKDIAIPFDQISFTDEPINPPAAQPGVAGTGGATATGGTAAGGGMAPAPTAGLATPADPTGTSTPGAAPATMPMAQPEMRKTTVYPNHGMISLTADQLKQAPAFEYAK